MCSAVLAHFILKEKLHIFGVVGCLLCVVGSVSIVLHAPVEKKIESVKYIWHLATAPGIFKLIESYFLSLFSEVSCEFREGSAGSTESVRFSSKQTHTHKLGGWLYESSI